jgi:hypothetical protein
MTSQKSTNDDSSEDDYDDCEHEHDLDSDLDGKEHVSVMNKRSVTRILAKKKGGRVRKKGTTRIKATGKRCSSIGTDNSSMGNAASANESDDALEEGADPAASLELMEGKVKRH